MFDSLHSMEQTLELIKKGILIILARNKGNLRVFQKIAKMDKCFGKLCYIINTQHTWCAQYTNTILGTYWGAHWVSLLNPLIFGHLYETKNELQS